MTRVIGIVSGKGGVGKTTLTANLSYALTETGKDVTAVDMNLTTPHLGLHLGYHLAPKSLHDFLKGNANFNEIVYYHPYGFKIIPASLSVHDNIDLNTRFLDKITSNLSGKTDFVILDSAPSLGREAALSLQLSDEILLVTNPNMPSVLDAMKVAKVATSLNKVILGIAVNRVNKKHAGLSSAEIESITKYPVISEIPEDANVHKSLAARTSAIDLNPNSPASLEIRRLAHYLVGKQFKHSGYDFWDRLFGWIR